MRTDLFDFELPPERIALRPASPRDSARMLVVQPNGELRDQSISDLPVWLTASDQLVVNDTKVIAAPLKGRRIGRETEPKIEATLIMRLDGSRWQALVKPAKKLTAGDRIRFGNEGKVCLLGHLDASVEAKGADGGVTLSFSFHGPTLDQAIADLGQPPLPPYIASKREPDERDAQDAGGDEQQHGAQCGLRDVGQQAGPEGQQRGEQHDAGDQFGTRHRLCQSGDVIGRQVARHPDIDAERREPDQRGAERDQAVERKDPRRLACMNLRVAQMQRQSR